MARVITQVVEETVYIHLDMHNILPRHQEEAETMNQMNLPCLRWLGERRMKEKQVEYIPLDHTEINGETN